MTIHRTERTSQHSYFDSNVRKRVCKACDRCRLKKTKCDGSSPCSRCRADNSICVFGERKKAHDKVYPKGYVEMIEQQQAWLVCGLRELYRRNIESEGWPDEDMKLELNGHPLTHVLLMHLGALDGTKGERFEESLEALQQNLWRTNVDVQGQQSSDGGSDSPQSPVAHSRCSSDAVSHHTMPPTPSTYGSSTRMPINTEPQTQFVQPRSMQGVVNPLALQGAQAWPSDEFNIFGEMELTVTVDNSNHSYEDQQLFSPMFNHQLPMNCMSQESYLYSRSG